MGDQQQEFALDTAQGPPAPLSTFDSIVLHQGERIGEGALGSLEADAMFAKIAAGLLGIPFESDVYIIVVTEMWLQGKQSSPAPGARQALGRRSIGVR